MSSLPEPPPHDAEIAALRLPPHSIEAEQSVLGGLLLSNLAWDRIGDVVGESDFYRNDHRIIYRAIVTLIQDSRPADVLTLSEALKQGGLLEKAGGTGYLQQLAAATLSAANIRRYAEIVRERSIMRKLAEAGTEIADSAYTPTGREAKQLLDEAEKKILEIGEQGGRSGKSLEQMDKLLSEVMMRLDELQKNPRTVTGVSTGFDDLDEMTAGLQPSDLIIVAGRPSMGKTAFALNMAEHVGVGLKLPVLIFSMEMGGTQIATRLLGSVARVDAQRLRTGRLDPSDWDRIGVSLGKLNDAPIHVDETPALNALELRSRARRLWRQYGGQLGLIVIDYLQLMSAIDSGTENRATEISEISRSMKAMAKELQVPVVALSQLNRSLEQRPNKRPVMSDLRECVPGDTLVMLADGSRVPIAELVGQTPDVLAVTGGKVVRAKADKVWPVGVRPTLRLTLASGRIFTATPEHRVLTSDGWLQMKALNPGGRVAVAIVGDAGLAAMAEEDLFWDTITAIEPAGEQSVFDLTVPGPSCWLADGIVSHNSGAIEQDADVIIFIYRDEVYNKESPAAGTAEIIIGKQRNGPIGHVELAFLGKHTRFENLARTGGFSPSPPPWAGGDG